MRAVFAVALCFLVGACATFGGSEPDPYGVYELVSINGEALPALEVTAGSCDLRADGTDVCAMTVEGMPEPFVATSPFTLGEFKDGCFPYESTDEEGTLWAGTICGETLTATDGETTVVMHKRR